MNNIMISVFTPSYNRGNLLYKLYNSLAVQTNKDFEWIIVDDGSTDNTKEVVESFISDGKVNIRYIYQKNSGKHIAINNGVVKAKGKYFFIVDSDDYITSNALELIYNWFKTINNSEMYAGIGGQKIEQDGNLIGKTFDGDYIDCTSLERKKNNIFGDKAEVFYTDILKKYPFPKIDDERFLPEAYVWNKIAYDGYKIRWFNEPLIVCEYLDDGLTKNASKLIDNNYKGQLLYIKDLIKYDNSFFAKIAHYSSYCGIAIKHYTKKEIKKELNIGNIKLNFCILIYIFRNKRWK